jgi:hypothetical protein
MVDVLFLSQCEDLVWINVTVWIGVDVAVARILRDRFS